MKSVNVFWVCAVLALAAAAPSPLATCPTIVSRAEWGARPPTDSAPLTVSPVPYVIVHHGASPGCYTQEECAALVRSTQNFQMDTNGYSDIGYSFLVGEDGNAYEGRGWDTHGAHAPNYNGFSMGICFLGNFVDALPNAAALATVQQLIACGVTLGKIQPEYQLAGHRQVTATECPGETLYAEIQTWPQWTATP